MADVRLTATNPDDSSVVPVACNERGELKLEEPIEVPGPPGQQGEQGPPGNDGKDGDPFTGNFAGDVTFDGTLKISAQTDDSPDYIGFVPAYSSSVSSGLVLRRCSPGGNNIGAMHIVGGDNKFKAGFDYNGHFFYSHREKVFNLIESNGVAMVVETDARDNWWPDSLGKFTAEESSPVVRNIPKELDMIEATMVQIMEKLRMTPPSGWEVWDGSSENS